MTLTNKQVAQRFLQGKTAHNRSMSTDGKTLYSYQTGIAKRFKNGEVVVNTTRYSATTSGKHHPALRSALASEGVKNVSYTGNKYSSHWTGRGYDYEDFDDTDFTQDNDDKYRKHLRSK
jgi:hypothetical protein